MPRDQTTLVLPGGNTRCIYSDSTPFAIQVIPGDSDKLVVYFQGGGACWDKTSTAAGLCLSDSSPQSTVGIFDRSNTKNALRSHTIVHVLYCSGDIFAGNVVRNYNDKKGAPVSQQGISNVEAAVAWMKNEQVSGMIVVVFFIEIYSCELLKLILLYWKYLLIFQKLSTGRFSTLSSLVVMGASAGSIGAQVWGNEILKSLSWKKAAIIPDSYAGVFPDGTQGPLVESFGMCTASFLPPQLLSSCLAKTLTLQDVMDVFMGDMKTVPYAFIQSKVDIVQQSFYVAVGATMGGNATITPAIFYDDVNLIFGTYNKKHANFLTYLVDGDQHTYTCQSVYYTADAKGPKDAGASNTKSMMVDWVNPFPLSAGQSAETICEGSVLLGATAGSDNTFCSSSVEPKTYVQV